MSNARVRLPDDWLRFDKVGLFGALLFPLALALLWLTGFGPYAYQACFAEPTELIMRSDAGKVTLSGRVGSVADKAAVVEAARQTWGEQNIVDKLRVDGGVPQLGYARNIHAVAKRLKALGPKAMIKVVGNDAEVEGMVADNAARTAAVEDISKLLGGSTQLKDGIVVAAAPAPPPPAAAPVPPPAAAPAPAPVPVAPAPVPVPAPAPKAQVVEQPIAKGKLGAYKLPNGSEISIVGEGLEAKVLAFLNDASKPVDKGLWFDFDRLHFKTGSAELTAESRAQIETLVAILKAYPNATVKIGGYTDNVGDAGANLKLSGARAARVAQEVIGLGVAADRVEAEGYGEQHPIASNDTPEGRALNRRTALSVRRK